MRKSKHKLDLCAQPHYRPEISCDYCRFDTNDTRRFCQIKQSLLQKYGKSGIDASESSNYSRFVQGKSKVYQGGYKQFKHYYNPISYLISYFNIIQTSNSITQIIRHNLKKREEEPINFKGKYCKLMHQRKLQQKGQKIMNKPSDVVKSTQTDEIRKFKDRNFNDILGNDKKKKVHQLFQPNESLQQILKLKKTLDKMCHKFKDPKILTDFDKELKVKQLSHEKKKKFKNSLFNEQIERKISEIRSASSQSKSKRKKKMHNRVHTESQYIYGLDEYYKKNESTNNKKSGYCMNHRVETEMPHQIEYDSPVSRAYYPKNEFHVLRSNNLCRNSSKNSSRNRSIKSFNSKKKTKISNKKIKVQLSKSSQKIHSHQPHLMLTPKTKRKTNPIKKKKV